MVPRLLFSDLQEVLAMNHTHSVRKGSPIPSSLQSRMGRHDDYEIIKVSGLSPAAYWKAKGGGSVNCGTHLRLERACDVLDRRAASPSTLDLAAFAGARIGD